MRLTFVLAGGLLAGLGLIGGTGLAAAHATVRPAGHAAAHNELVASDPADGASLASGPQRVVLTFDQPVKAGFNTITVTGSDGAAYTVGEVATSGNTASTALAPIGKAGEYVIGYRVVSADGHAMAGTLRFRLTRSAAETSTAAGTQPPVTTTGRAGAAGGTGDGGPPVWPWVLAAIVLLGAGIAVALRRARCRQKRLAAGQMLRDEGG